jgi:uncharacterized protein (TIGR03083 family)
VERTRQLDSIRADLATIGTLTAADPAAPVPACPDWTRADLRAHVSRFARLIPALLSGEATNETPRVEVPADEAVVTFDADAAGLVAALAAITDDGAPAANWSVQPDTAGFWVRRAVHELAVHRVDAGSEEDLPRDVALDGIAEFVDTFVATGIARWFVPPAAVMLVLDLIDAPAQRHDLPEPGPETVVRGSASDVALALWHRRDLLSLHAGGDATILENWPRI